jgi:enoyl-CoA hydratase/carnithine racemase
MPPPARLERDGDVAELVLASPPLNLFDAALFDAIGAALGELEQAPARALLFRAEGEVFTAGVDVHLFAGLDVEAAHALTGEWLGLTHRLEALPFPTMIAVVHGLCRASWPRSPLAQRLAAGPTLAHAATKAVVRAQADAGTRGVDDRVADLTSHLFDTDDVKGAVETFLREGPGKASFTGS